MAEPEQDVASSLIQESGFFPSWLWLSILSLFMAGVVWLCLRNVTQLLPLKIQRILQDLVDRAFGRGRIRLLDDGISEDRRPGIPMGLEGDSDEDDDELPQFPMHSSSRARGFAGTLQASKDKVEAAILSLVAGRSQRFRRLPEDDPEAADSERILVLPNISSRHGTTTTRNYKPKLSLQTNGGGAVSPETTRPTSSTLFRRDSSDADAPPLPSYFNINHHQSPTRYHSRSGSGDRTPPLSARSPTIRSPALSRTPSLLAIAEESSVSPPATSTTSSKPFSYIRRKSSSSASASTSSGSSEQGLQDWASAMTSTSRRREDDPLHHSP